MRRCSICDSQFYVGSRDGLCRTCRNSIAAARNMTPITDKEQEEKLINSEHYSMNHIDTSVADYYSRKNEY